MYNIAICDDEICQIKEIKKMLKTFEENNDIKFNIVTYSSGEELLESEFDKYHVIFLDIHMQGLNGIDTAKSIRESNKHIQIVFITSLEQYWPEGYSVRAFRYILKPINEYEFFNTIELLLNEVSKNIAYVALKSEGKIERVLIEDIKYIVIENRKVEVHTKDTVYNDSLSLAQWEKKLSGHAFTKPHNSYLVNLNFIKAINKSELELIDGDKVYVSQRKYKDFKDRFIEFIDSIR